MRMYKAMTAMAIAALVFINPVTSYAGKHGRSVEEPVETEESVSYQELSATEVDYLVFMREEEKLARDVYLTLYGMWNLPIFENIAASEQTHTDAIRDLIVKYNLIDPVVDDTIGVFVNQELIELYAYLLDRGDDGSLEALYVGALIEEVDIEDIQLAIEAADNDDIRTVYENLMKGSRNHLRAFVGLIEDQGIVYEAQYLPQDEVDAILDSPRERGKF